MKLPNGSENYPGIDTEKEHPVVAKTLRALAIGIDATVEFLFSAEDESWSYRFRRSDGSYLMNVNAFLRGGENVQYQIRGGYSKTGEQRVIFYDLLTKIHREFSKQCPV